MTAVDQRDYYTVPEAARELDVNPSTVWRWISAGELPAHRVGRRNIRIRKGDLQWVVKPVRPEPSEAPPRGSEPMTIEQWQNRQPPTPEEIAKRHAAVARILANREGRSIAPLTTGDLIRQVRDEREERHRSWLKPSS